jgi:hypothetical protein
MTSKNSISTTALHHYTTSIESLKSILEVGMYPSFCKEAYLDSNEYWIPMISFCDIPLDLANEHRSWYGNYAIAFRKEWVERNDIHPVHYIKSTSINKKHCLLSANNFIKKQYITEMIPTITGEINKIKSNCDSKNLIAGLITSVLFREALRKLNNVLLPVATITAYEKLFEGKQLNKKVNRLQKKKFYDEKEWRYILPNSEFEDYLDQNFYTYFLHIILKGKYFYYHINDKSLQQLIGISKKIKVVLNGERNSKVAKYALKFKPKDIAYILVPSREDKKAIILKNPEYSNVKIRYWKNQRARG